jgi:hypothetical protein
MSSLPSSTPDAAVAPGDFDFLIGRWRVAHRRLRQRLAGCTEWDHFTGTTQAWPLMAGFANVDDNGLDLPGGAYRAISLRAWNPATRQWAIWWLDGRHPHQLDVPVAGGFSDGVGRFHADDLLDGRPIRVRFLWSDITASRCRWQQAFSADGGQTWETNWVMDLTRLG